MTTTTNAAPKMARAEVRRLWKEVRRNQRYQESGFLDLNWGYRPDPVRPNKYVPHIGKKQIGRGH